MARDHTKRNQNLIYHYHQDVGYTTENCQTLWSHLEQLVSEGRLKKFLYHPNGQGSHSGSVNQRNNSTRPHLGTINVIFAAPGRTGSCPTRVMSVSRTFAEESDSSRRGLKGTFRLFGSGADIMYLDLFRGLNLKLEDLTAYDSPLISFEGKAVIPKGQIRLPVQSGPEVVDVDFIVVDAYSPYTAILARPWLHALGAVSSTLHVKVKFPSGGLIKEIIGSQFMARQCITATILRQTGQELLASAEGGL
ncbi:uncharacterized protein LOC142624998 [Castanea sativa]|uniref:uncharacterized protein LOC142624998 n=1 Tax=Castanea sativa TaxID=21020 RepID=UPI003F64A97E